MFKIYPFNIKKRIKETEIELRALLHELAILNASSKGLYSEAEIKEYLKVSMAAYDSSAFNNGVRSLKSKKIFEVHPNVAEARNDRKLEIETSIKLLNYRISLLNECDGKKHLDEYKVIEAIDSECFDSALFNRSVKELQNESLIFPVQQQFF